MVPIPVNQSNRRTTIWSDAEREALPDCQAVVRGETLRYTIRARYRIWTLDCPEKGIHIWFDKTKKQHSYLAGISVRSFDWAGLIAWGAVLLVTLLVFLKERRGTVTAQ